jgi:2-C-methyl-D-erythritol 4-phosphate cytidylyltransferase
MYALIVAAGSGSRMQSDIPKQFLSLKGKPVLYYTLETFCRFSRGDENYSGFQSGILFLY